MKKLFAMLSILVCLAASHAEAQTWDEWFKQKKTQKKYLAKQIVLLRIYLDYLKKGYEIANKGYTTISNIKNGDFNLHRDFFGSLRNVNPAISNSAKVADIIAFQVFIIQELKRTNNFCKNNSNFNPEEIRYVSRVYYNMLFLCDASITELLTIIRSDETEMKDDERLQRIDKLYDDMLDKHAFVKAFDNDVHLISWEREREKRSLEMLNKQYDLF